MILFVNKYPTSGDSEDASNGRHLLFFCLNFESLRLEFTQTSTICMYVHKTLIESLYQCIVFYLATDCSLASRDQFSTPETEPLLFYHFVCKCYFSSSYKLIR